MWVFDHIRRKPRKKLEHCNFGLKKKRDCTICVAKTKVLIICAVSSQLICVFVFAYSDGFLVWWLKLVRDEMTTESIKKINE